MARGKGSVNSHTRPQETVAAVPTNRSVCMVQIFFAQSDGTLLRGEEEQLVVDYIDDDGYASRDNASGESEIATLRASLEADFGIRLDYPV